MPRVSMAMAFGAVAVAAAGAVFVLTLRDESDPIAPPPVDVRADGPVFATLDELIGASDRIVEATVVGLDDGRTITDPNDATSGVRTRLVQLDVVEVFLGSPTSSLIVEEEATLLDGTPIIVNGAAPVDVGASGFFFLVDGATDEFPYVAVINEQGRYLSASGTADALHAANSSSPLARDLEAVGVDALRSALRSA